MTPQKLFLTNPFRPNGQPWGLYARETQSYMDAKRRDPCFVSGPGQGTGVLEEGETVRPCGSTCLKLEAEPLLCPGITPRKRTSISTVFELFHLAPTTLKIRVRTRGGMPVTAVPVIAWHGPF